MFPKMIHKLLFIWLFRFTTTQSNKCNNIFNSRKHGKTKYFPKWYESITSEYLVLDFQVFLKHLFFLPSLCIK